MSGSRLPWLGFLLVSLAAPGVSASPRALSPQEMAAVQAVVTPAITYDGPVEFGWPKYVGRDKVYCGSVFARDLAGGYTFYAEYHVMLTPETNGQPHVVLMKLASEDQKLSMQVVKEGCANSGYE